MLKSKTLTKENKKEVSLIDVLVVLFKLSLLVTITFSCLFTFFLLTSEGYIGLADILYNLFGINFFLLVFIMVIKLVIAYSNKNAK
jgi:hypothetical protein